MSMPFTVDQFFQVFESYNTFWFPGQILILLPALVAFFLIFSKTGNHRFITLFLGLLWLWNGISYHWLFFASINPAAWVFGGIFVLQGILFLQDALGRGKLSYQSGKPFSTWSGYLFILIGWLIYPAIGYLIQGDFSHVISLGLPCPTTILTFGFLMLVPGKIRWYFLVIPTIWAVIGFTAALNFGVYQDVLLPVATIWFFLSRLIPDKH